VLVSVPNVVNWQTRLAFLFGRFEYQSTGVLDRTHVRFFTFRSAARLLQAAGCSIEKTDFTPLVVRAFLPALKRLLVPPTTAPGPDRARAIIDSPLFRFYVRWIYPIEYALASVRKPLFAFRIVLVARMSPTTPEASRPAMTGELEPAPSPSPEPSGGMSLVK
jgi:hypothetical protein